MTRLRASDIKEITIQLKQYNRELLSKTGHTLAEIAAHAVGALPLAASDSRVAGRLAAVVPLTCGQGIIGGFAETVAAVLRFLGMAAFVPRAPDAKGIAEAIACQAEILFLADDDRFIAMALKTGRYADNSEATGKGFVAALDYMTGGLKGRSVLILGAGPVGCAAALAVLGFGGRVHVYDKNAAAGKHLARTILSSSGHKIIVEPELAAALHAHRLIVDACPAAAFITAEHLYGDSFVAAPGVPLGVHAGALAGIGPRLVHDPLQLGVATMLYDILQITAPGDKGTIITHTQGEGGAPGEPDSQRKEAVLSQECQFF